MLTELLALVTDPEPSDETAIAVVGEMLILSERPWSRTRPGLRHGSVQRTRELVTVTGRLGPLTVEVELRPDPDEARNESVRIALEWRNDTGAAVTDCAPALQLTGPPDARVTMPQVIYHDNPSAAPDKATLNRSVPHVSRGGFVTQEHRLPIPAVCAEWAGETWSLLSFPDANPDGCGRTRYGALGAIADTQQTLIIATNGVVMFDGRPDVDYVHKARTAATADGYLTLAPGDRIRRSYLLCRGRQRAGRGFRELVRLGTATMGELNRADVPAGRRPSGLVPPKLSRSELIALKTAALDARWFADDEVAGYLKFPAWGEARATGRYPEHSLLYGWTGQCLRLAWCDAVLGLRNAEPERVDRCRRAVDSYLAGSATGCPGLRWNDYRHDDRVWHGIDHDGVQMISARAYGETLVDLADIVATWRTAGLTVPDHWVRALVEGAEFVAASALPEGVVPIGWQSDGAVADPLPTAAGAPAAHAIARAYALTGEQRFRHRAEEMAEAYHRLSGPAFERPYACATLDAACEDKEAGMAQLRLLLELSEHTGDRRLLCRAQEVADWLLSWVYHWSPLFDRGSQLELQNFTALGWPGVSVQNHHLDAFFPTSDLWRLGTRLGDDHYRRWAIRIDAAIRQGVCTAAGEWGFDVAGEQAEAFFVTDWQQRGTANTWNPSWVIALPLWHALELEADGVLDHVG